MSTLTDRLDSAIIEVDTAWDLCHKCLRERWTFAERMTGEYKTTDLGRLHDQLKAALKNLNEARAML